MSLVRSADSSANSFGESTLYGHKMSDGSSTLSNQLISSDRRMFNYGPESYRSEYPQYFSRTSTGSTQHIKFRGPSSSAISGSIFYPQESVSACQLIADSGSSVTTQSPFSSCVTTFKDVHTFANLSRQNSSSVSHDQSPDNAMDYDEDEIRSKLQELERELFDDNDEDLLNIEEGLSIDEDWVEPMRNLLLPNSPKESSSDSNISSTDSIKEPRTAKQLLFDCAGTISEGNLEEASAMITELRQMVSIQGDPPQRLAAYLVEGLAARIASSGKGLYKALKCKEPPTSDRLSAMQILFELCPCFKFGFMAANGAIVEAFKNEVKVHIIDFDINQGSQYITLMQTLSSWPTKPKLRITGVDDPESVQRAVGGLKVIGLRLEKLAEHLGIPFEFRAVAAKTWDLTSSMLVCHSDEALVVNFAFQLHHMPDESVSTVNQRDKLLRMVKGLQPKLVTLVEQDVNTNTAPFLPRFVEVYNYYSAVFDSLEATMPRDHPDRMNVERQCLARDIVNIVACEGADRIERYEVAGKWRARMTMAGFSWCPLSTCVNGTIRTLLRSYCDRYTVKEEGGALHFGWDEKSLIVASAWK
uniref:Scarecrow-like protein 1 n=1 Tax=Anthurium amnicola TaxID=1678845 RepID=A0A1D1ZI07_9ARAE